MKKKIIPTYKTHLRSETNPKKPLCREFRTIKQIKKLTDDISKVTCETCKHCLEVNKRKNLIKELDEYFNNPKNESKTITREEYKMIKQEMKNIYSKWKNKR